MQELFLDLLELKYRETTWLKDFLYKKNEKNDRFTDGLDMALANLAEELLGYFSNAKLILFGSFPFYLSINLIACTKKRYHFHFFYSSEKSWN